MSVRDETDPVKSGITSKTQLSASGDSSISIKPVVSSKNKVSP